MDHLALHPQTKAELTALQTDPPHALLLLAPAGTGKFTVAQAWSNGLAPEVTISTLEPDEKGTITIEATRSLYQRTRSRLPQWQVVIIDHAEAMSLEAQNSFLKLLEEPRPRLTFVLTAPSPEALLPTILSRLHMVMVQPVSTQQLIDIAKTKQPALSEQLLTQLLFIARGRPAIMAGMLADPQAFDRAKQIMQRAKTLISASSYERLAMVPALSKDRHELVETLEAMSGMLELQLQRQPTPALAGLAEMLDDCLLRLRQNGNARAQLTWLFTAY